jgi:hypothetical protein
LILRPVLTDIQFPNFIAYIQLPSVGVNSIRGRKQCEDERSSKPKSMLERLRYAETNVIRGCGWDL